ncbi:hypothetical protein QJS10_CPB15g01043 [Acorus calamus]|uniref:18S pre-ribosomal assembly protein gar2-related n=1 Tax=Acorus calamus TaxID=4465 RepID=A0AAV9D6M6_ACOCL|nr:hypothetical protein QJS10_CPB15g01043 [Acorus calamus]
MRIDSGTTHFHSSPAHEPTSKTVECGANGLEPELLKENNDIRMEWKIETIKNGIDNCIDMTIQSNDISSEVSHETSQSIPSDDSNSNEKAVDSFTDKTVTDDELPEKIICVKEGAYHVVKDICIDEGVCSPDKILLDTEKVNHDRGYGMLHSEIDEDGELDKSEANCGMTGGGVEVLPTDGQPALDADREAALPCSPSSSEEESRDKFNPFLDNSIISDENVIVENILPPWESDLTDLLSNMPCFGEDNDEQLQFDQGSTGEVDSTALAVPLSEKMDKTSESMDASSISVVEGESGPTATNDGEKRPDTADQQSCETPKVSGVEETVLDVPSVSMRSFYTHGHGDSFSGAPSSSGRISCSGQIPYSGSISFRSDSSTTSTRSFAFPILHSEWNSSPVKMARAERRHYRKHRGWKIGLLCCRF